MVGRASNGREGRVGGGRESVKGREGRRAGEEGGRSVVVVVQSVERAHISVQARTEMQRIRCPSPCGPECPKKIVTYSLTARAATPFNCQASAQHCWYCQAHRGARSCDLLFLVPFNFLFTISTCTRTSTLKTFVVGLPCALKF